MGTEVDSEDGGRVGRSLPHVTLIRSEDDKKKKVMGRVLTSRTSPSFQAWVNEDRAGYHWLRGQC